MLIFYHLKLKSASSIQKRVGSKSHPSIWSTETWQIALRALLAKPSPVDTESGSQRLFYLSKRYSLTVENVHLTTELLEVEILVLGSTNIIYEP